MRGEDVFLLLGEASLGWMGVQGGGGGVQVWE